MQRAVEGVFADAQLKIGGMGQQVVLGRTARLCLQQKLHNRQSLP
ncbi:hypothetical protein [Kosakonia sp. S42]|nr:hypothetical protein [Kosakonia sp. S42]